MYHTGIDQATLKALKKIATTKLVDKYYLAGGTACALHLNHRISYDLDFFSLAPLEPEEIRNILLPLGQLSIIQNEPGTFNGMLDETKISFFIYPYHTIDNLVEFEQTSICSLKDLACMKLESIASRGAKRDFVDLYHICLMYKLLETIRWFKQKYQQQNVSVTHVLKSLVYFPDADSDPEPNMTVSYDWDTIKDFFALETPVVAKDLYLI